MRNNTKYEGYLPNSTVIQWFWEVVMEFDQKLKRNFLFFVTGIFINLNKKLHLLYLMEVLKILGLKQLEQTMLLIYLQPILGKLKFSLFQFQLT